MFQRMAVWLRDEVGARLSLVGGSLVLGRSNACHVVLDDPTVSRQHAIVVEVDGGARVVPLGRTGVRVQGTAVDEPVVARDGDVLEIARSRFTFEIRQPKEPPMWHLEIGARRYPVRSTPPFRIGGESADLSLPGWPDAAVTLYPTPTALLAELHAPVVVDGSADRDGEVLVRLAMNATLTLAGTTVRVVQAAEAAATLDLTAAPSSASLELMPNGALLTLTADKVYAVWLPHKRGDLVAALLLPPNGLHPGAWVPDEVLIPRVWGAEHASRTQLNTLIHRTRISLGEAGLNGPAILERAPGGGATRFRLSPHAVTSVA